MGVAGLLVGLGCAPVTVEGKTQRLEAIKAAWTVEVSDVVALGPYRAATLTGKKGSWQLYFPRSGPCAELVRPGARPVYRFDGPFGLLVGDDRMVRCSPVGIGSLAAWRDQRGRRRSQYLVPREQARFSPVPGRTGDSEAHLLVRGSFPLALEIRWPEPMDAVAVLPATRACREQLLRRKTTMEFRAEGPEVLVLRGESGECPIVGLALPLAL
jgi:hypothetical protein